MGAFKSIGNNLLGVGEVVLGVAVGAATVFSIIVTLGGGGGLFIDGLFKGFEVAGDILEDGFSRITPPADASQKTPRASEPGGIKNEVEGEKPKEPAAQQSQAATQPVIPVARPVKTPVNIPEPPKGTKVTQLAIPVAIPVAIPITTNNNKETHGNMGSEFVNKIKTNPLRTVGTVLLALLFPVGTIIAGVIVTGVAAKSGHDVNVNNKKRRINDNPPTSAQQPLNHGLRRSSEVIKAERSPYRPQQNGIDLNK